MDLKRQSEDSGPRPDKSSLVFFIADLPNERNQSVSSNLSSFNSTAAASCVPHKPTVFFVVYFFYQLFYEFVFEKIANFELPCICRKLSSMRL